MKYAYVIYQTARMHKVQDHCTFTIDTTSLQERKKPALCINYGTLSNTNRIVLRNFQNIIKK